MEPTSEEPAIRTLFGDILNGFAAMINTVAVDVKYDFAVNSLRQHELSYKKLCQQGSNVDKNEFDVLHKAYTTLTKTIKSAKNARILFKDYELRSLIFKLNDIDHAIEKKIVFSVKPDGNTTN